MALWGTLSGCLMLVCCVGLCHSFFFSWLPQINQKCSQRPSPQVYKTCFPCSIFKPKQVTVRVVNTLREPLFDKSVILTCTRSKFLFRMMQEAAELDSAFRFSASFTNSKYGFFVDSMNGLTSTWTTDQTWWAILNSAQDLINLGVSFYRPSDGETLTFNFTQSPIPDNFCPFPGFEACPTCLHEPRNVTIRVLNQLRPPLMDMSLTLCTYQKYLQGVMEEAAQQNSSFRFTVKFFNNNLGYSVSAYNNVFSDYALDQSYWRILNGTTSTPLGISNYVPADGETNVFNLTTWGH